MSNLDLVREITARFQDNDHDEAALAEYFSPDFVHWANGRQSDLAGYTAHLERYERDYERFTIPSWDEAFEAGDKVVVAYTLEATRQDGGTERMSVMAIWRFEDGKVAALREVDGR